MAKSKDENVNKAIFNIGMSLQGIALLSTDVQYEKIKDRLKKIEDDVLILINHIEKLESEA